MEKRVAASTLDFMKEASCSFTSLLGLALDPAFAKINLIPTDILLRRDLEARAKDLALMGSLFLALVTMVSVVSFEKITKKGNYLDHLKSEYKMIRFEAEELERTISKMKIALDQINSQGRVLDVLRDINEVIPESIQLTFLQFDAKEKAITMRGVSEEMSAVFQFLSTLEAAPYLESVKTRSVTKRRINDVNMAEFEIVAEIPTAGTL